MKVKNKAFPSASGQSVHHTFTVKTKTKTCHTFLLYDEAVFLFFSTAALTLPRFTPEGVTAFAQWGLLALIGYWILTIVLRLLMAVFKQVFWVVRTVLALWFFGLIVSDKTATSDTTALRLSGLVLVCALLTLLSSTSEKSRGVEKRLSVLENRLRAVEKRKGE